MCECVCDSCSEAEVDAAESGAGVVCDCIQALKKQQQHSVSLQVTVTKSREALKPSPAVTALCDFCLQGGITVFKDLGLN